ncbi:MAG: NADH-quinone oxidoreductase subunit NuoE [Oscillospiraceae bacterium]|nr:NADH-quinone oxidoreductase subunit NuoE [Oscillospiraceae bacterium]
MEEKNQVPFSGTLAQELQLKEVIAAHKEQPGCLMPVLQQAQEIYGYLPIEVQAIVAEGLGISLSEVYGVATFYSQFRLNPKGIYRISICLGTACYVKGAAKVLEAVERKLGIQVGECTPDGLFSLESCRCVGACGLAPVMMINDEVFGRMTPEQVPVILEDYARKGGVPV